MAGDFNVVSCLVEKRGSIGRLDFAANLLRDNIELLNLVDVKPNNGIFTWNNIRSDENVISKRLDQFLISCYWIGDRWTTSSEILDWKGSDHWSIKFSVVSFSAPKNPSFKFQLMWLWDPSL